LKNTGSISLFPNSSRRRWWRKSTLDISGLRDEKFAIHGLDLNVHWPAMTLSHIKHVSKVQRHTNDLTVFKYFYQKLNGIQKWNLQHWKVNLKTIVACGGSYVTQTMATRSATVDMAVKWRFRPKKFIEYAHGGFLWNKTPLDSCHRFCGLELEHTKRFLRLSRQICCHDNSYIPWGHLWRYITSTECYRIYLNSTFSSVSFISVSPLVLVK
jgi:hypothetical protein